MAMELPGRGLWEMGQQGGRQREWVSAVQAQRASLGTVASEGIIELVKELFGLFTFLSAWGVFWFID
jgi:hypothetical protein